MDNPNWTDLIQTVGIVAALLFTAWEMRTHTREQKLQSYLNAIAGSVDLAKMLLENPQLHGLYNYSPQDWTKSYEEFDANEKSLIHYCDLIISVCESVWLASQEKWLKDEWGYWGNWIMQLNQSPAFRWTIHWVESDYDPVFISEIKSKKFK